jgi:hypothetical protein
MPCEISFDENMQGRFADVWVIFTQYNSESYLRIVILR